MADLMFYVRACWDDEAKVFYSESDIIGLHIEADTLDEFEEIMKTCARDLIFENHVKADWSQRPLRDLVPSILWQRPEGEKVCA